MSALIVLILAPLVGVGLAWLCDQSDHNHFGF